MIVVVVVEVKMEVVGIGVGAAGGPRRSVGVVDDDGADVDVGDNSSTSTSSILVSHGRFMLFLYQAVDMVGRPAVLRGHLEYIGYAQQCLLGFAGLYHLC